MNEDHLAALLFDGASASSGSYSPKSFDLRLLGAEQPTDHIVYLHEVHHGALNDSTAWGTALHIFARLPREYRRTFGELLDACRTTHESFATFASVEIAAARHGPLDDALAAYPAYIPLYRTVQRALDGVTGPNRRQLAVNALARLCMQTPVLDLLGEAGPAGLRLGAVRNADRPDHRWNRLTGASATGAVARAAEAADRYVTSEFGAEALDPDAVGSDLYSATLRAYDDVWEAWEMRVYAELGRELERFTPHVLGYSAHQAATEAVLEKIRSTHGDIGLRPQLEHRDQNDDAMLASSVLQQVRHSFAPDGVYRAAFLPVSGPEEIRDILAQGPEIEGRPRLIIDVRTAPRLRALYQWPDEAAPDGSAPIAAVRVFEPAGEAGEVGGAGEAAGRDTVLHIVIKSPDELAALVEVVKRAETAEPTRDRREGGGRGGGGDGDGGGGSDGDGGGAANIACVGASCLADRDWVAAWLAPLRAAGLLTIAVDVEPDRVVPGWIAAGATVNAIQIGVDDPSGARTALVLTTDGGGSMWLVLGDDVTVNLWLTFLADRLGEQLVSDAAVMAHLRAYVVVVLTHLLATESFTSFDALA